MGFLKSQDLASEGTEGAVVVAEVRAGESEPSVLIPLRVLRPGTN